MFNTFDFTLFHKDPLLNYSVFIAIENGIGADVMNLTSVVESTP